jgi:rRNA maturation endonuclease Nob1
MGINVEPSFFVRQTRIYKKWCAVTNCRECDLKAKYEDCHPVDPCPNCGGKLIEKVGRWNVTVKPILFGLLRKERGEWELKPEK